jgi:hypothetical protein
LRKNLSETRFEELEGKTFELIQAVDMLCEVCKKPINTKEKFLRKVQFLSKADFSNLLERAKAHDHADVDVENRKIYFHDHDFPGDVHPECIEKL